MQLLQTHFSYQTKEIGNNSQPTKEQFKLNHSPESPAGVRNTSLNIPVNAKILLEVWCFKFSTGYDFHVALLWKTSHQQKLAETQVSVQSSNTYDQEDQAWILKRFVLYCFRVAGFVGDCGRIEQMSYNIIVQLLSAALSLFPLYLKLHCSRWGLKSQPLHCSEGYCLISAAHWPNVPLEPRWKGALEHFGNTDTSELLLNMMPLPTLISSCPEMKCTTVLGQWRQTRQMLCPVRFSQDWSNFQRNRFSPWSL